MSDFVESDASLAEMSHSGYKILKLPASNLGEELPSFVFNAQLGNLSETGCTDRC